MRRRHSTADLGPSPRRESLRRRRRAQDEDDFFKRGGERSACPSRNSVLRAGMGVWRPARVGVSVRAASGTCRSLGPCADDGCQRMGKAAGPGGDRRIRASRLGRSAVLRAGRAPVGVSRTSRCIGGSDAMGRRGSSARGVFVSDYPDFAHCAAAEAAGHMDSAWRVSALERFAPGGAQVIVGEGLYRGCFARAGFSCDFDGRS